MALAYVKDTGVQTASGVPDDNGSFGTLPSAGNAIFVMSGGWHTTPYTVDTVTDNQSNTYTEDKEKVTGGGSGGIQIYSDIDIGTPSGTFTITVDPTQASSNYMVWLAVEFSGVADSAAVDLSESTSSATGDAALTTAGTTAQADELVLALAGVSNDDPNVNLTNPTTGYTELGAYQNSNAILGFHASYKIVSATGTQSATWTHDNTSQDGWAAIICTYKAAAGGGASSFVPSSRTFQNAFMVR